MSEWKIFDGSDEQIKELNKAINHSSSGVLLKLKNGTQIIIRSHLYAYDFAEYLICNPHPRADMICQQARTGQPVWVSIAFDIGIGELEKVEYRHLEPTTTPDWNIPGAEYRLTPFDDRDQPEPSFHGDTI